MTDNWKPRHVSFCHSADNLAIAVEIIRALEARIIFTKVLTYAACGNGALLALMKYVGYSSEEIEQLLSPYYSEFAHCSFDKKARKNEVTSTLRKIVSDVFRDLTVGIPSLKQLYLLTGKKLYLSCYNVTKGKVVYLSCEQYPEMSVLDAVLLSMSVSRSLLYEGESYVDACAVEPVVISCLPSQRNLLVLQAGTPCTPFLSQRVLLQRLAAQRLSEALFQGCDGSSLYLRINSVNSSGIGSTYAVDQIVEKALQKITKVNKKILYSKEIFE